MSLPDDLNSREHRKFRDNSSGEPAVAIVNPDGTSLASIDSQNQLLAELQQKTEPSDIQNTELTTALKILIQAVTYPPWFDRSVNQIRSQVSGSVTATMTSTSIVNFGSFPADHLQRMDNRIAWATSIRNLIT